MDGTALRVISGSNVIPRQSSPRGIRNTSAHGLRGSDLIMRIRMEEINGRPSLGSCSDDNLCLRIKFRFRNLESEIFTLMLRFIYTKQNRTQKRIFLL